MSSGSAPGHTHSILERISDNHDRIAEACRRHEVAYLAVFGSVANGTATAFSDIDFVVDFTDAGRRRAFSNFFGLKEALSDLLGRRVDLVSRRGLRNPIFIAEIERTARGIYDDPN